MLYGDINPSVKLEDVLIPLKEAKAANAEKEPEVSKKASGGDVEMKAAEQPVEAPKVNPALVMTPNLLYYHQMLQ